MALGVILMALHAPAAVEAHKLGSLPEACEPAQYGGFEPGQDQASPE